MLRKCDNCGCPLGAADIEAAQCPACRKTVWRHVVENAVGDPSPQPGATDKPRYQGTLLPPSFPSDDEDDEEEFGANVAAPFAAPANKDRRNAATLGDSSTLDTATDLSGLTPVESEPPTRSEIVAAPGEMPEDRPAISTEPSASTVVGTVTEPATEFPNSTAEPLRQGATRATVDPRYFGDDEWERWEERLASSMTPHADIPAKSKTAGDQADTAPATESRYVGKTSVSPRILSQPDHLPTTGADYSLLRPLGAGGMGIVYEATQRSINRAVALKMLKPESARRRDRRDSLATEAIVTGELTHPNIVPIHDLGQDAAGNLFYSMKRVEGSGWDRLIAEKSQSENLEILLKVADAIAFAHSRGVVHRDLKPENVLLGDFGEVLVMDWGLAYATDRFRKLESITTNTAMGGSPAYMAPEQAIGFLVSAGWQKGTVPPITPALDTYLLGAILFEIVTGSPPHEGNDPAHCVIAAAENRIRDVETESGLLPIALKAMATDPADRYASVEELQKAVREYSRNAESVSLTSRAGTLMNKGDLARAVVGYEDALELWPENPQAKSQVVVARRRLARRRYALVAMTAAFLLAIGIGGFGINYQRLEALSANEQLEESVISEQTAKRRAETAASEALFSEKLAKKNRALSQIAKWNAVRSTRRETKAKVAAQSAHSLAERAKNEALLARDDADRERERQRYQNYQGRIKLIDARIEENAFAEADRLLQQLAVESPDLCGWEWGRLKFLCTQGRRQVEADVPVAVAAATGDGSFVVTGGTDGRIRAWSGNSQRDAATWEDFPDVGFVRVTAIAVSSSAHLIAAAGTGSADIVLFRGDEREPLRLSAAGAERSTVSLSSSADGSRLLSAGTDGLRIWNTASGRLLERSGSDDAQGMFPITCAALSADGRKAAAGLADGQILVWDAGESDSLFDETRVFDGHRTGAEFGDGFRFTSGVVTSLAFLPDDTTLVSGGDDGRLLRWNLTAAEPQNDERDLAAAFSSAVSATQGGGTAGPVAAPGVVDVAAHTGAISTISMKIDERGHPLIVTGGDDGLIKIWRDVVTWPPGRFHAQPQAVLRGHQGRITAAAAFSPPNARLHVFSAGVDTTARVWDVARYEEVRELRPRIFADHEQEILSASFDPAGRRLMTSGRDERLVVTDLNDADAPPSQSAKVHSEAISVPWIVPFPDGKRLATGYLDGSFAIWDVARRTTLARVTPAVGSSLMPPAVSLDAKWIAASWRRTPEDRSIGVWSVADLTAASVTNTEPRYVFEPRGEIFAAAFTADGKLAFGDRSGPDRPAGGHIYVADLESGDLATHRVFGDGVEGRVYGLKPLKSGDLLAAGNSAVGAAVRVVRLDPASGRTKGPVLSLEGSFLSAMAVSNDGRSMATLTNVGGKGDQSFEMWDLESGARRWTKPISDERMTALDLSPDGQSLLAITEPVRREGDQVIATGRSEARLYDAVTGDERRFGPARSESFLSGEDIAARVSGAAFSIDGRRVYLAAIRGVAEWDVERREVISGTLDSHGTISASAFSADGRFIVDGHRDGSFEIRDASSSQLRPVHHQPRGGSDGPITAATFTPLDGSYRFLIASHGKVTLREFDPASAASVVIREFPVKQSNLGIRVRDVAFSHDGLWFGAACDDGTARMWHVDGDLPAIALRRPEDATADGHVGAVTAIAFPRTAIPSGYQVIATGGADRNILVWVVDTHSGETAAVVPLRGHRGEISQIAFLPDRSDVFVSASEDGTAKLWDWDRGGLQQWNAAEFAELHETEEVLTLAGRHTAGLTAVDVSHDGLTILTAGRDGRAVLWTAVAPPRPSVRSQEP